MQEKDNSEELSGAPNDKYEKFFAKFKNIETLDVSSWKTNEILAYFCKKYKQQYNINYQFKFNNPSPSKCFEIFQVKKLASMLSTDPQILKDYIDWIYENKVIKSKRRLTSISFMTNDGIVKEYKLNILLNANKIDRSTLLPNKYLQVLSELNLANIKTYGDLAFLNHMQDLPVEYSNAFDKLKAIGFDKSVLNKII